MHSLTHSLNHSHIHSLTLSLLHCRVEAAVYNHTAAAAADPDDEIRGDEIAQLGLTKKNFTSIEEACVAAVLLEADIIVTTCIGAGVSHSVTFHLLYFILFIYFLSFYSFRVFYKYQSTNKNLLVESMGIHEELNAVDNQHYY